ncbi:MAG TPA: tetratricopeptide repeat protein [Candidatus Acidoferrum sp.]|nr:tetratricopeptide repeat protein [Candidatus Acidoferrum sp.]
MASPPPLAASAEALSGTADLIVTIRDEKQVPFTKPAKVTLRGHTAELRGSTVSEKGRAVFRGIPLDTYEVQVEAPGYSAVHSLAVVLHRGEMQTLEIILKSAGEAINSTGYPQPPVLSPKEQKDLTAGLRSLQAQNLRDAQKHLRSAAKTSPNHPDVNYLLGLLAAMRGEMETAKQYFENAAARYQHVLSLTTLGEIYLAEGNLAQAKARLEAAIGADPNFWRADQLLAAVFLRQHSYPQAIQHSERALQLGKSEAKGARLTLAQALSEAGDRERSDHVLDELLRLNPTQEQSREAKRIRETNQMSPIPATFPVQPAAGAADTSRKKPKSSSAKAVYADLPFTPANLVNLYQHWIPPNVDDAVPSADTETACPLPQILKQTGDRVVEFVTSVDHFSATETMNHSALNEFGLAVHSERRRFNYLVAIREFRPGDYDVQEFRDGLTTADIFPEHVATVGTVALVFVFHPSYAGDFNFVCEGRTHQGGQEAWQIHFAQKPDHPPRLRSYRLSNRYFRVGLKGRAWISTESFQVLRLESDLSGTLPEIRLRTDHEDIQYGPVLVKRKDLVLWLPTSSEIFLDFNGHRIHRQQSLSDYFFFWVD